MEDRIKRQEAHAAGLAEFYRVKALMDSKYDRLVAAIDLPVPRLYRRMAPKEAWIRVLQDLQLDEQGRPVSCTLSQAMEECQLEFDAEMRKVAAAMRRAALVLCAARGVEGLEAPPHPLLPPGPVPGDCTEIPAVADFLAMPEEAHP